MKRNILMICVTVLIAVIFSCKESVNTTDLEPEGGIFNPFDTISYDTGTIVDIPIDSATFLGLHTHIFSKRCNQPACHDGTFEPDFRTVQSAYNTLVFHSIIKNYPSVPLDYRVQPGEPENSMIYHRLTIDNPPNFESMPSSGIALPQSEIDLIHNWIAEGAKDIYGNEPMQTSLLPTCYGMVVYEYIGNDSIRVDTIRQGSNITPFLVQGNFDLEFWFVYGDQNIDGELLPGYVLGYNKFKVSDNPYDFTDAITLDMEVELLEPLWINSAYSEEIGTDIPHFQHVVFNPSDYGFSSGDRLYVRTYVQDDDHDIPTEIPQPNSPPYMHTYFSFDIL
ncbi:MAG: hypothetical protein ACI94Y_003251 [Maribacter sp.]|jgi:hypothetical protein